MARATTRTILALDRFARLIGLNPAHFNGAAGGSIMTASGACAHIWKQHDWQAEDRVSRETLAREIAEAERQLASALGYWPGPKYEVADVYRYPRPYRADAAGDGYGADGRAKAVRLRRGKFIQAGRRAVSLVSAGAAVVASSPDGDSFNELGTVTVAMPAGVTDVCELKVYYAGKGGAPEWEIRPARSKTVLGGNAVLTFDRWQLIDPDLWETLPTDQGEKALDLLDNIYKTTVDVYREYTDFTQASAQLLWEPGATALGVCSECGGSGCPACELTTQDGCMHVRDVHGGWVVPTAATYDQAQGAWGSDPWTVGREPDLVKLWYLSGDQSQDYLSGADCDPMPLEWAKAVTMLAVCRLERPLCSCKHVQAMVQLWRTDLAMTSAGGDSHYMNDEVFQNPFGTRRGEVMAYRAVFGTGQRRPKAAVVG